MSEGVSEKVNSGFSGLTLTLTSSPGPKSNPASPQHPAETPAILRSILRFPSQPQPHPTPQHPGVPSSDVSCWLPGKLALQAESLFLISSSDGKFLEGRMSSFVPQSVVQGVDLPQTFPAVSRTALGTVGGQEFSLLPSPPG